jgi:hypothetical protein
MTVTSLASMMPHKQRLTPHDASKPFSTTAQAMHAQDELVEEAIVKCSVNNDLDVVVL